VITVRYDEMIITNNYCHLFQTVSRIGSCIPILSKIKYSMIQIICVSKFCQNCYFGHGKYGAYFLFMNEYLASLNLLLDYQILFLYHPNLCQE
jgi:hypothetical protein